MNGWAGLAIAFVLGSPHAALAQQEEQSLYDRLGGRAPISVVVHDFLDALVPDRFLNENPAIDAARERVPAPYLKYHVTAMVCQATGGPCQYQRSWDEGDSRSPGHYGAGVGSMVTIFKEVLARHDVPARETQELLDIVESTKADIVAPRDGD